MQEFEGYWQEGLKHGHGKQKTQINSDSEIYFKECKWNKGEISEIIKEVKGSKL